MVAIPPPLSLPLSLSLSLSHVTEAPFFPFREGAWLVEPFAHKVLSSLLKGFFTLLSDDSREHKWVAV